MEINLLREDGKHHASVANNNSNSNSPVSDYEDRRLFDDQESGIVSIQLQTEEGRGEGKEGKGDDEISLLRKEVKILQDAIESIMHRNKLRELDKSFESSYFRLAFIMALTYGLIYAYMIFLGVSKPELNAVVPAIGFNLSTWSIPYVKYLWLKFQQYRVSSTTTANNSTIATDGVGGLPAMQSNNDTNNNMI